MVAPAVAGLIAAGISAAGQIGGSAIQASNTSYGGADPQWQYDASQMQRREDYERQKEFAKMGLRWRVSDAKAAGIHPLAAIGSATYSPGGQGIFSGRTGKRGSDYGLAGAASEIGKYFAKDWKLEKQINALRLSEAKADLRIKNAQADVLQKNLQSMGQGPEVDSQGVVSSRIVSGPNARMTGQADASLYQTTPVPTSSQPGIQSGTQPLQQFYRDDKGYLWKMQTQGASEPMENDFVAKWDYMLQGIDGRYRAIKYFNKWKTKDAKQFREYLRQTYPKEYERKGHVFRFDPFQGKWKEYKLKPGDNPRWLFDAWKEGSPKWTR